MADTPSALSPTAPVGDAPSDKQPLREGFKSVRNVMVLGRMQEQAVARGFDPDAINRFRKGILTRDLDMVAEAIESGASPATSVDGLHPLIVLAYGRMRVNERGAVTNEKHPYGMTMDELNEETSAIVNYLLDQDIELMESDKYATDTTKYLPDLLVMSPRLADVSNIVIRAIHQELTTYNRPYQIDPDSLVYRALQIAEANKATDERMTISDAIRQIGELHETVRQRLLNPRTETELEITANFPNKLTFWTEPYLPTPVRMFENAATRGKNAAAPAPAGMHQPVEEAPSARRAAAGSFSKPAPADGKIDEQIKPFITVLQKRDPQDIIAEIAELTGNEKYKDRVEREMLARAFMAIRASKGLKNKQKNMHMALTGSTGTGKTTLARLDAEFLYSMGFGGPYFAEISREKVISGHIGGTEEIMRKIVTTAHFVFVDEAPQLVLPSAGRSDKQDFGNVVVGAAVPAMENNRNWQIWYWAGYTEPMKVLLKADTGFLGRVGRTLHLEDPTREKLIEALDKELKSVDLEIEDDARQVIIDKAMEARDILKERFPNFRAIRSIVEELPQIMSERIMAPYKKEILSGGIMAGAMISMPDAACKKVTMDDVRKLDLAEFMGLNMVRESLPEEESGYQGTYAGFTGKLRQKRQIAVVA